MFHNKTLKMLRVIIFAGSFKASRCTVGWLEALPEKCTDQNQPPADAGANCDARKENGSKRGIK